MQNSIGVFLDYRINNYINEKVSSRAVHPYGYPGEHSIAPKTTDANAASASP